MVNMVSIVDMFIDEEIEVTLFLKGIHNDLPYIVGKITARGDDFIEFEGKKHFPPYVVIPIDNILMIKVSKKKGGKDDMKILTEDKRNEKVAKCYTLARQLAEIERQETKGVKADENNRTD